MQNHPSPYAPYDKQPFAGDRGMGSNLVIRRQERMIICHRSVSTYLFLFLGFILFGPMLVAMYYFDVGGFREQFHAMPWLLKGALIPFLLLCETLLGGMLLRFPRLLVDLNRKRISLCSQWLHASPEFVIEISDMALLKGMVHTYQAKSRTVPNFQLALETRDGNTIQLCVSCDRDQVETLAKTISESLGVPAQLDWQEDPDSFYAKVQQKSKK